MKHKGIPRLLRRAEHATELAIAAPLPQSINWLLGLGFKVGIYLFLKSALIIWYLICELSPAGITMLASQFFLAVALIISSLVLQDRDTQYNSHNPKLALWLYGSAGGIGLIVVILRRVHQWGYFKNSNAVNWFVDFFSGLFKNAKEIGMSFLFLDNVLWVFFCLLLFIISLAHILSRSSKSINSLQIQQTKDAAA